MEMDEETEYELLRQRNIEENLRMLASLGLEKGTAENALLPVAASGRVKPKPAKRRFSAVRSRHYSANSRRGNAHNRTFVQEEDRPTPVRSSRRLQAQLVCRWLTDVGGRVYVKCSSCRAWSLFSLHVSEQVRKLMHCSLRLTRSGVRPCGTTRNMCSAWGGGKVA